MLSCSFTESPTAIVSSQPFVSTTGEDFLRQLLLKKCSITCPGEVAIKGVSSILRRADINSEGRLEMGPAGMAVKMNVITHQNISTRSGSGVACIASHVERRNRRAATRRSVPVT
jgi:heterodisulfide reductase subunit C